MWQSLEILIVFNTLTLKQIFSKTRTFFIKTGLPFLVESTSIENATFSCKIALKKPMLRLIEWGIQDGPIAKNGVLPVTTLVFRKFCFSLRTLYNELIWSTSRPKVHTHAFRKRWSFIFSLSVSLSGGKMCVLSRLNPNSCLNF